ncbi:activin receptor type-2B [Cimex lectularius]|uniref:Serine/threonine-protein kinase receptor n=1 Tax=Cimex lectularius TaxID=79782 RepID=A0A8I6R754_CIMLE|nr:activin receptor type-2B [Cimex lectularius]
MAATLTLRCTAAIVLMLSYMICLSLCHTITHTTHCEFHNETLCNETGSEGCNETVNCEDSETEKRGGVYCFVLWHNNTEGKPMIKLKGCFLNNNECSGHSRCVESTWKELMFCCCEGNMCNRDFYWEPTPPTPTQNTIPGERIALNTVSPVLLTLLPVVLLSIAFVILCWVYRNKKGSYFNEVPTMDPHPMPPSPTTGCRPIQLIEVKAKGRFGAVWKAQYKADVVAVKVFPVQDKQSWLSEQQIYKLPHMKHDCILRYIDVERHGDGLQTEFWLITSYHENGSLCDFLKANTLTWPQLCRIAESMARGLMHLHEEMSPTKTEGYKPAVAHRDFKSRNVLLKSDLTACIADFGLALIFQPGKPCGDTHGQVGTRRYMAPEVLEGAINFSRDAFLRIDMYACGLVLWELATRCTAQESVIGEYQLPFEEEVGQHPTLEDMQECVVHKKQRPILKNTWRVHPGLQSLCDTMEECWDHDAEARLSASCVMERIAFQAKSNPAPLFINDPNLMDLGH